jgi:hypothetical protein
MSIFLDITLRGLLAIAGLSLVFFVLWDGFETIVFPRRVTRKLRLTRLFYHYTWFFWTGTVYRLSSEKRAETYLSIYGPLSLLLLLVVWAAGLIFGFALLLTAFGTSPGPVSSILVFGKNLYLSGTNFFTLGLGDVAPQTLVGRALTVIESGLGFGFLALTIGYLPALNQSFARREENISMLDARAGSPPTALEMLRRHSHSDGLDELGEHLYTWERWAADILESHLSYPVLGFFRSQHDNESWISALAVILDVTALMITGLADTCKKQAELTFAMARHTAVDLAIVFNVKPLLPDRDRLPSPELARLRAMLAESGIRLETGADVDKRLTELRLMYEPYLYALGEFLCLDVPPWILESYQKDNWQTSPWPNVRGDAGEVAKEHKHRHF